MGQRSQVLILMPPVYYNEKNPNNKPNGRLYVWHNQWTYGAPFVRRAEQIMTGIKNKDKTYIDLSDSWIEELRRFANGGFDVNSTTNFSKETAFVKGVKDADELLDKYDNNNGYLIIVIQKDGSAICDMVTGYEDSPERRVVTGKVFTRLAGHDEELEKDDFKKILESLNQYEGFGKAFQTLNNFLRDENKRLKEVEE